MPTYEYVCRNCGERLEAVQSFYDDALTLLAHAEDVANLKKALRKRGDRL